MDYNDHNRCGGGILRRDFANPRCREPRFNWHVASLRDRLRWRVGAARARAGFAAQIQGTGGVVRCAHGRALRALPDDLAAMANMGTAHHLVCDRHGHLLRLWRPPQQTREPACLGGYTWEEGNTLRRLNRTDDSRAGGGPIPFESARWASRTESEQRAGTPRELLAIDLIKSTPRRCGLGRGNV